MNDNRLTDELKNALDDFGEFMERKLEKSHTGGWSILYDDPEVEKFYSSNLKERLIPIAKEMQVKHDIIYKRKWHMFVSIVFLDGRKLVVITYRGREFSIGYFSPDGKFLR